MKRNLLLVVAAAMLVACGPTPALTHEVYVRQRVWNAPVRAALEQGRESMQTLAGYRLEQSDDATGIDSPFRWIEPGEKPPLLESPEFADEDPDPSRYALRPHRRTALSLHQLALGKGRAVLPGMSIFEDEFRAFERAELRAQLPRDPVLFYGSSSIRLWKTLARDFAGLSVVNRGFGGSTLRECVAEMERLVFPVAPRAIVLYAGDNDLDQGARPEEVQALFEEFVSQVDDRLGLLPMVFISIKASTSRLWNIANIRRTNALIRETLATWPQARFLDVFSLMLHPDGQSPRRELYSDDGLHLSAAGYVLWAAQVRACLSELGLPP